ncbi:MAG: rRNA pseudouridine synthase [Oscillospiraceae bacterium]|nr:rRNA pseudouridine synthase [Oscillospiraceae bacterium]
MERVDKILANMGYGSRSEVKKLIKYGRVNVNGSCVKDASRKVSPDDSEITVDGGERLKFEKYVYLMLNKPKGYISATHDARKRTVAELIPEAYRHYDPFPVGRLDIDTEGLILLTNDGELCHCLLSPRKHVEKRYAATLDKSVDERVIKAFRDGVLIDGGYVCKSAGLKIIKSAQVERTELEGVKVEVAITEGKYHQIKRMFAAFGINVLQLKRIEIAGLKLDSELKPGKVRELMPHEIKLLMSQISQVR